VFGWLAAKTRLRVPESREGAAWFVLAAGRGLARASIDPRSRRGCPIWREAWVSRKSSSVWSGYQELIMNSALGGL
jgi:hypothetical protein